MGQYNKAVLTAAGERLIARTLAGEIQLNITKAKTSNYIYPAGTDFKSLTDMQGIKQTVSGPTTAVYNDTMIQTRVLFSNEEIVSTYYIHNIGLYAMDGTQEVLFCIVTADTPDEMPQYNGVASTSYIYNIQNVVQDAVQLNITVNPSGTATIQDVLERVDATGGDISETVIETLDTVEDKYPIPTAGESVKRFFGKVLTFLRNIRPLTGDINIYVSTTGSDITGDGGESNPYASIRKALSIVPKNLNGFTASIYVSDGTYTEDVNINGIKNGLLILRRDGVEELNSLCNINKITASNCDSIHILGFNLTAEKTDSIYATNCEFVYVNCCQSISISFDNTSFSFSYVSIVRITGCRSQNHSKCLWCYSSYIYSGSWSADSVGIQYGIYVDGGGRIATGNVYQPVGMTISNEYYAGGSIITSVFGAKIGTLKSDTILYVSTTTGSDTTGNGTSANPFKTIQHAIDIIPKNLNGYTATIIIAAGTYPEDILISGFSTSGILKIVPSGDLIADTFTAIGSNVIISSDTGTHNIATNSILISDGANFHSWGTITWNTYYYRTTPTEGTFSICAARGSTLYISGTVTISGNTTTGLKIISCSKAYIGTLSGYIDVLNIGVQVDNMSLFTCYTNNIVATTKVSHTSGGMEIQPNGTQISDLISSGLSCTWGTLQGGYIRHGNSNGRAMITIQLRVQTTTTLSAGVDYVVTGFPTTFVDTAMSCNAQFDISNSYINTLGTLIIRLANPRSSGAIFVFNCTYRTTV